MNYKILNSHNFFPALIVDDWYTKEEKESVWKELDFYTKKGFLVRSENRPDTATDETGNKLARSFRIYPDNIYNFDNRNVSDILTLTDKFREKKFHDLVTECFGAKSRMYFNTNRENCLISYYENNDYYDEHCDVFAITILIWLYKEPKKYKGGDLILTESNCKIENINNRMVMFPSYYLHKVTPVNFNENLNQLGYGRYTITHFFFTFPGTNKTI
jgi:Rps23 Pro-64 3,4-dihydroxylase Tpa1-like proline 4-hydroxylase